MPPWPGNRGARVLHARPTALSRPLREGRRPSRPGRPGRPGPRRGTAESTAGPKWRTISVPHDGPRPGRRPALPRSSRARSAAPACGGPTALPTKNAVESAIMLVVSRSIKNPRPAPVRGGRAAARPSCRREPRARPPPSKVVAAEGDAARQVAPRAREHGDEGRSAPRWAPPPEARARGRTVWRKKAAASTYPVTRRRDHAAGGEERVELPQADGGHGGAHEHGHHRRPPRKRARARSGMPMAAGGETPREFAARHAGVIPPVPPLAPSGSPRWPGGGAGLRKSGQSTSVTQISGVRRSARGRKLEMRSSPLVRMRRSGIGLPRRCRDGRRGRARRWWTGRGRYGRCPSPSAAHGVGDLGRGPP